MARGRDGLSTGNIDAARRKRARREAAARAARARVERAKALERKHIRAFLSPAVKLARRHARDAGWTVDVQRSGGSPGWRGRFSWTQAAIEFAPTGASVQFSLGDGQGRASSASIHVRVGKRLVRQCSKELLESGDRAAFAKWLEDALRAVSVMVQDGAE